MRLFRRFVTDVSAHCDLPCGVYDPAQARYEATFDTGAHDLEGVEDMRVLDFNGHQIMANFSLEELGDPIKFGG